MKKRVLLTGAFGNIGSFVIRELLAQHYDVVAFDKETPITKGNAKKFSSAGLQICWGDITHPQDIERALKDVDAVIHLVGIFPPASEANKSLAKAINVDGTRNVVEAMEASLTAKRLVFASSIAVYGKHQGRIKPPLNASHPLSPDDYYGETKAEGETLIKKSALAWSILRISACPPVNIKNMASFKGAPFLELHPDSRLEIVHPADSALAFVNALGNDEAKGKILLLGGGKHNQITSHQLFSIMFASLGLQPLPREAFKITEEVDFHGDWLDTEESQRLLKFQRYDAATHFNDFRESLGLARYGLVLLKPLAPLIRWFILLTSPYYKTQKRK